MTIILLSILLENINILNKGNFWKLLSFTDRARFYLESSGWEVELALGSFYEANAIDSEDFQGPDHEAAFQHPLSVAARYF